MCLTINNLVQMANYTIKIKSVSNSPITTYGTQLASPTLLHTPYGSDGFEPERPGTSFRLFFTTGTAFRLRFCRFATA